MAVITLNVTDEEKKLITDFSEANNMSISELILKIIENLEDEEDYKLAEQIINDPNTKYTEGIEDLAKECGIDYDAL
ncbi:DUF6290 family protein [Fusobacterium polymorphum]|uniref:DUF6290 family protein n=1 Tax=Fusobacterium nucleatum subsp. polymorphum TaxID=76857 RepID=UPI00300A71AD